MSTAHPPSPPVEVLGNSPERIYVTEDNRNDANVRRHVARYLFASQFIQREAIVLDCACGSGYGTHILAPRASRIMGVDRCPEAIAYAHRYHHLWNGGYLLLDLQEGLSFPPGVLDAVVTLETIEHLPPEVCRKFLADIAGWVKPGGVVVASSPMLRYRDGQPFVTSPYHINELPREQLLSMLADVFPSTEFVRHLYHQEQEAFPPLLDEHEGFAIMVARKRL